MKKKFIVRKCGNLIQVVRDGLGTVFQSHDREEVSRWIASNSENRFITMNIAYQKVPLKKHGEVMRIRISKI